MIRIRLLIAVLLALSLLGLRPTASFASTTLTDCPSSDSALSSDINTVGAGGTVYLVCPSGQQTIGFTNTITITQDVVLSGKNSPTTIAFDGGNSHEFFIVNSGASLELDSLRLQNSYGGTSGGYAGAVYVSAGSSTTAGGNLIVHDSTFANNSSEYNGGAIRDDSGSTVTVADSTFDGNWALGCANDTHYSNYCSDQRWGHEGGAIDNLGTLTVTDSTFSNNKAIDGGFGDGGAISNEGTASVTRSTFTSNLVSAFGGAVYNKATMTVSNSTFYGNSAHAPVGCGCTSIATGGAFMDDGTLTLTGSTITGNSQDNIPYAGGGIGTGLNPTLNIGGDIVSRNTPTDCSAGTVLNDWGYNLNTDSSCLRGGTGDISGQWPYFVTGAPQDNGGPTETLAPQNDSPVIDQIPLSFDIPGTSTRLCPAVDQRGLARPDDSEGTCDMGAYELGAGINHCPVTESALSYDLSITSQTLALSCPVPVTIPFASELTVAGSVTVDASGSPAPITLDGTHTTRLFHVPSGAALTLDHLTLSHGYSSAGSGGAVSNDGTLSIANSTISNNSVSGSGGAFYNDGTMAVVNSTLVSNIAPADGGAIVNDGKLTVTDSTLSGNLATYGGGVRNDGTVTIADSTLSGNSASSSGGALYTVNSVTIGGSILAGNLSGGNCGNASFITDGGYNLTDGSDNCGLTGSTDLTNTDPKLDPNGLGDNGGPTQTIALQPGSPAIDAIPTGSTGLCANAGTDQRGDARPDANEHSCDLGAYEYNGADLSQTISWTGPTQTTYTYGDPSFSVSATASSGLTVTFSIASGSSSVCSSSGPNGATISITGVGDCTVLADQGGNSSYLPAPQVAQHLTIKSPTTGCPLTEAALANDIGHGSGGAFTFQCSAATTITFSTPITITGSVTLDASGSSAAVTLDGGGATQLFGVNSGAALTVNHLTLAHGNAAGGAGGAIGSTNATVAVTASILSGNSADDGGAISIDGGSLTISQSTLSGNSAKSMGGAVFNAGSNSFGNAYAAGTVTISRSTLSGNAVIAPWGISGGAIENDGTLSIHDSTLSGNSSYSNGGAVSSGSNGNDTRVTLSGSTLSGNSSLNRGAQILNAANAYSGYSSVLEIGGTIIANTSGAACYNTGSLIDDGYNLTDSTSSCGLTGKTGDLANIDPKLDSNGLQSNGGPTQTIALEAGSPAIDQIPTSDASLCPTSDTDQRGLTRPDANEGSCDIGAYEYDGQDHSSTTLSAVSGSGTYGGTAALTATLTSGTTPVSGKTVSFTLNGIAVCGGSTGVTCPSTDSSGVATLSGANLAGIDAGSYATAVGASFTGDASYAPSTATGALKVSPAGQTITFGPLTNHTYGDAAFTVNATASSGLTVTFTVGSTDQCTISGTTVTITAAGSCTVTASQGGDGNYSPAPSVSQTFTIAKASATITLDAGSLSATYDGNPHLATATTTPSGLSYGVSYTDSTGNPVTSPTNAGSYGVTAAVTDANYAGSTTGALVIAKTQQSIAVSGHAPSSATYGAAFTVAANASSGLGVAYGSSGACSNTGATFTMTSGTGTCTVTYDQAGNGNYSAAGEVTETVTAHRAPQTLTFGSLANHTYGDQPSSVSATASSGLPVSFTVGSTDQCTISGSTVTITGAGSCTVTAAQAGNGNYNAAPSVSQTFSIAKAGTITTVTSSANPSILRQGVTFTITVTSSAGIPGGTVTLKDGTTTLASGLPLSAAGTATFTTSTLSVGTHGITASYSGSTNFAGSATGAPLSQQVRYTVKVLSTSSLMVVLQLLDYSNSNVSASALTVTAECVVSYSQTPPTSCGATPVQTITKAFGFTYSYRGVGSAYSYSVNSHGLTKGQQYYLLVQTDGDPVWHAIAFTF